MVLLAINGKYIMKGVNCKKEQNMHSSRVKRYVLDVEKLFALRDFPNPVNFNDKDKWANIIASNLKHKENIATQWNHPTNNFFSRLFIVAGVAHDSPVEALVYYVVTLGRIFGPRASEYAETTQTKVDGHKYSGGSKVMKVFIGDDFQLFDRSRKQIHAINESILDNVYSMKVFWCIKINEQNGQSRRINGRSK